MQRILSQHGQKIVSSKPYSEQTPDERKEMIQKKCDSYNESEGNLNQIDGYECKLCKNRGDIAFVQENRGQYYETLKDCKCKPIRRSIMRMKRSGLESVIHRYTFDSYQATDQWQQLMKSRSVEFVQDERANMLFFGGASGSGKSHLCTAVTAYYLRKGKSAYYMLWKDEATRLKSIVMDDEAYQKAIHALKTVDVLYIDDFWKPVKTKDGGTSQPTEADISLAYELLNYRYNNPEYITIISSERYATEIFEIDEAIGGRLIERAGRYAINVKRDPSKNYRVKHMEFI